MIKYNSIIDIISILARAFYPTLVDEIRFTTDSITLIKYNNDNTIELKEYFDIEKLEQMHYPNMIADTIYYKWMNTVRKSKVQE